MNTPGVAAGLLGCHQLPCVWGSASTVCDVLYLNHCVKIFLMHVQLQVSCIVYVCHSLMWSKTSNQRSKEDSIKAPDVSPTPPNISPRRSQSAHLCNGPLSILRLPCPHSMLIDWHLTKSLRGLLHILWLWVAMWLVCVHVCKAAHVYILEKEHVSAWLCLNAPVFVFVHV